MDETTNRQLHLNLFIHGRGHHEAAWRHPTASPLALTDIRYYTDLARRAEITMPSLVAVLGVGMNSPVHLSELYSCRFHLSIATRSGCPLA